MNTKPCPYCSEPMPNEVGRSTCGKKTCHDKRRKELFSGKSMPVWYGDGDCIICGARYEKQVWNQTTCGSIECYTARNRQRNKDWAAVKRNVKRRNAWLSGKPPYGEFLPGGLIELTLDPHPKWPLEHRNLQGLHGMVTTMLGVPHEHVPVFSLVPSSKGCGWGVYVRTDAWKAIAGQRTSGRLFEQHVDAVFSPLHRIQAPVASKRGRQRVVVSSITPVCTKNSKEHTTYVAPCSASLKNSLVRHLCPRLGIFVEDTTVCVETKRIDAEPDTVQMGGKFGAIRGWVGSIELEVNAVAFWLLEVAGVIGLGGRTALGFGRVKVQSLSG